MIWRGQGRGGHGLRMGVRATGGRTFFSGSSTMSWPSRSRMLFSRRSRQLSRMYWTTSMAEGSCAHGLVSGRQHEPAGRGTAGQRAHLVGERDGDEAAEEREVAPRLDPQEAQQRVQILEPVLDRRARHAPPAAGLDRVRRLGGLSRPRLDVVRLVEDDPEPLVCPRGRARCGVRFVVFKASEGEPQRDGRTVVQANVVRHAPLALGRDRLDLVAPLLVAAREHAVRRLRARR